MKEKQRDPENRTITVSIPIVLVEKIDVLADEENRSRSNWIVRELQSVISEREKKAQDDPPAFVRDSPETKIHGVNEPVGKYPRKQ